MLLRMSATTSGWHSYPKFVPAYTRPWISSDSSEDVSDKMARNQQQTVWGHLQFRFSGGHLRCSYLSLGSSELSVSIYANEARRLKSSGGWLWETNMRRFRVRDEPDSSSQMFVREFNRETIIQICHLPLGMSLTAAIALAFARVSGTDVVAQGRDAIPGDFKLNQSVAIETTHLGCPMYGQSPHNFGSRPDSDSPLL